jgi:putative phage-type endonuclease
MAIILDVIQGSPEWLALRQSSLGATSASVLSGTNPFKDKLSLYNEMVLGESVPMNDRMRKGMELEPVARELCEEFIGEKLDTPTIRHKSIPFMHASYDGIDKSFKCSFEIKCSKKCYEDAVDGIIPIYYQYQMQQQMLIAGLVHMFYAAYWDGKIEIIKVYRDDKICNKIEMNAINFYESHIRPKIPPKSKKEDIPELIFKDEDSKTSVELNLSNLEIIREKIKNLQKIEEYLEEQIFSECKDESCRIGKWRILRCTRKGAIKYKDIPELENVDLEKHRGEPVTFWKIS